MWNGTCPTSKDFPQKKLCSSVQAISSYRCVKTAFTCFLYNTHLSVAGPYWLYLAERPTIVCLDMNYSAIVLLCLLCHYKINYYNNRQDYLFKKILAMSLIARAHKIGKALPIIICTLANGITKYLPDQTHLVGLAHSFVSTVRSETNTTSMIYVQLCYKMSCYT